MNHDGIARLGILLVLAGFSVGAGPAAEEFESGFRQPPPDARPWVYWVFMDGNQSRAGITADLEAMRCAGIGGAIMMEVDIGIPRGPVRFMSDEWRENFKHIASEAARLGLKLDLITSPGWTGTGGPWVKPEQSMQHLVSSATHVLGPARFDDVLPRPQPREPFFGLRGTPPELEQAWREFYRDEAVLAFPTPRNPAGIPDLDEKALYYRAPYSSQPGVKPFLPAPAVHAALPSGQCVDRQRIVDLTDRLSPDGRLAWDAPAGDWTILRFGRASTGQNTRPAPLPGLGFECDKFDRAALDAHFQAYIGTLLADVAPDVGRSLVSIHLDSWEMSAQNWTANFRAEFRERRGYDPLSYLPILAGVVVDSPEISERFLWDLRQTAQELVVQNHAERLRELAHERGLEFSVEPYDMNPCADLALGAPADVPMCEFWSWGFGFDANYSVFEAVSIAHLYSRPVVGAEAFTAMGSERWLQYPGRMKAQGDWAFCSGVNRIVFHRYQHQPELDRAPGMTMGPFGVHWERTQTWWEMAPAYHEYLARCQFMLQRGLPVADILYLAPEGAPHVFRPPASALFGGQADRRGYNFDGCSPEALLTRVTVQDGKLTLPGGMTYRVLVLPDFDTMTPKLVRKIGDLVQAGATVIGAPPRKSPSLADYPRCDADVRRLAAELWGSTEHETPKAPRRIGQGRLIPPVRSAAEQVAEPDPLSEARWIWCAEGRPAFAAPVGSRYFRRVFTIDPGRVVEAARLALTADNEFEVWVNGQSAGKGDDFTQTYRLDVARLLKPGENLLAVLAVNVGAAPNPAGLIAALDIRFHAGDPLGIATDHRWRSAVAAPANWKDAPTSDAAWGDALELGAFDMAPWNRTGEPATFPDVYPSYDFVAELLAAEGVPPDFESDVPLRYTHRREDAADVYFVANPADRVVAANARFRVSGRRPELWHPISGQRRALPDFAESAGRIAVPLRFDPHESFFVLFREKTDAASPAASANFPIYATLAEISGPWRVRFQAGRGAPDEIPLDALLDLSKHPDPGVRCFSGVAEYRGEFDFPATPPADPAARVYLDLGRVAVMAQVVLNGRDLGVVWTPPYRVDATNVLRPGANTLEIRVANLWPNRLIGDAALPPGQRVAWTTWNPFSPDAPLPESGLLGPVTLQSARTPGMAGRHAFTRPGGMLSRDEVAGKHVPPGRQALLPNEKTPLSP